MNHLTPENVDKPLPADFGARAALRTCDRNALSCSAIMADRARLATMTLLALFAVYLVRMGVRSAVEITGVNDFEVFHNIGAAAARHDPTIYELVSPVKKRAPFLYPPSAAVLFVPLSWLSHDVSGIVFSVLKIACLLLLYWGAVRFSGLPPPDAPGTLIVLMITAFSVFRPVDS